MKSLLVISASLFLAHSVLAQTPQFSGGVGLEQTRVVMKNGEQRTSVGFRNASTSPVLVATRVETLDGKLAKEFEVTPAVYQLKPGKTGKNSIIQVMELPKDRESVFWVNVISSPPETKGANQLTISMGQRMKLFYRPEGLKGNTEYAAKKLIWSFEKGHLKAVNPTGLSVSMASLHVNGKDENIDTIVMPFDSVVWPYKVLDSQRDSMTFTFIDEWGNFITHSIKAQ